MALIEKIRESLRQHTARAKREATEDEVCIPVFHDAIQEGIVAKTYQWPYRHIIIDDFLKPASAAAAAEHFNQLLEKKHERFDKRDLYDLYARAVRYQELPALDFLFDLKYKSFLEGFFNVALTEHVMAVMHNNVPRVEDKYVHHDYSKVFFHPKESQGRLTNTAPHGLTTNLIGYGVPVPPGSIIERRAVTAILYLSPDWRPGLGGETGIFAQIGGEYVCTAKIAPRFNRLLIFENLPHSFHNYMASALPNRNSIIEWFHVPDTDGEVFL